MKKTVNGDEYPPFTGSDITYPVPDLTTICEALGSTLKQNEDGSYQLYNKKGMGITHVEISPLGANKLEYQSATGSLSEIDALMHHKWEIEGMTGRHPDKFKEIWKQRRGIKT